ncbi:uncharacterized protein LOC135214848 [Macrobrachium nipponense]|uniref:uncharacterized protein LOC135214848 n=1 Tax=Macrobrachium nipponense TaxID=159736 RepID=UPI0030C88A2C
MVGTKTTKTVTIEKRGAFGDDPFFRDSLEEWDHAMKNVVDRWEKPRGTTTTTTTTTTGPTSETKTVYRQIRSSNVSSDDSQAVSCTEDDDKYKMMVDVKDFKPEDINVKTVDDTVVIEGKIEKKEGNAISTQKFTRRFILPPGVNLNAISSALSRDGVLTINAPKLAIKDGQGRRTVPSAGASSHKNGATVFTRFTPRQDGDDKRYLKHSPLHGEETVYNTRGGGGNIPIGTSHGNSSGNVVPLHPESRHAGDHWKSFNQMVEKSQKEMEDMMRRHTLQPEGLSAPTSPPSISTNMVVTTSQPTPPAGIPTNRTVAVSDRDVTEKKEQRWTDNPAPGVTRTNRVLNESTALKGADGSVVGNKSRQEHESHAQGSNEETLPDGTKKSTFTKSYETRKVFSYNSSDPKAV